MKLEGKNIIVTGASRGFGRFLALALWEEGANLLLVARNAQPLATVIDRCPGQRIEPLKADLTDPIAPYAIFTKARQLWSCVDGLVNNAAVQGPIGLSWETDWQDWTHALNVDLLTPIALCRAFVPWMLETGGGKIVNLSGGGASRARPNFAAYATAKTALVRFSECLAAELAGKGIDVNCVAPGTMPTRMMHEIVEAGPDRAGANEVAEASKVLTSENAMRRAADLIVFLLSSESDGISGKLISAVWDDWQAVRTVEPETYTLRRVTP